MTASEIASLLKAKRTRQGQYLAKCPAHRDKTPSLAIGEGKRGVLLYCQSQGCTPKAILDTLGLTIADLFYDKPLDKAAVMVLREQESKLEAREDAKRRLRHAVLKKAVWWKKETERLARLLMSFPDNNRLDFQFKYALSRERWFTMEHDSLDLLHLRGIW